MVIEEDLEEDLGEEIEEVLEVGIEVILGEAIGDSEVDPIIVEAENELINLNKILMNYSYLKYPLKFNTKLYFNLYALTFCKKN